MLAVQMTDEEYAIEDSELDGQALAVERELLERSLYEYAKAAWHLVEPSPTPWLAEHPETFVENWHLEELCHVLEDIYYGRLKRVIANVPPGTMKSLLVEVFFPTWVWAKNAKKRFLCASYGQALTTRDNVRARQIVESPWFQERWSLQMLEDQNTKTRYNTDSHGWRIATSVRGVGTGEHPDFIIIDDPTTADQAMSETERKAANDWFDATISTRLGRNPAIIVIMQRLHVDDLSGHLLTRGGWTHVCWPMRYEATRPPSDEEPLGYTADPRDHRTVDGELLFPALFPEEKVKLLELNLGPQGTAGQMQQRPSPKGGGDFKEEWFQYVDRAPALMRQARGWDTAASEDKGDYTVGCRIGEEFIKKTENGRTTIVSTGRVYIIDVRRGQLSPDGVDKLMLATAQADGKGVAQREEREGGASGKAQISSRAKLLKGWDYAEVQLGKNKRVRAKPLRSQCEAGNVYLVRAPWNAEFVRELCAFPTGSIHDDQVDAASCAYNSVLLEEPPKKAELTWGTNV